MIDSTPNRPRPSPAPTVLVDRAPATASTPTFTPRNATTRSRRRCRGKYRAKVRTPMATRSAANRAAAGMGTSRVGDERPVNRVRPSSRPPLCGPCAGRQREVWVSRYCPVLEVLPGLEVLPRALHVLDPARGLLALLVLDDRADEHDALPLLAGDARPVVGVGGVRQVLVLLELVDARGE